MRFNSVNIILALPRCGNLGTKLCSLHSRHFMTHCWTINHVKTWRVGLRTTLMLRTILWPNKKDGIMFACSHFAIVNTCKEFCYKKIKPDNPLTFLWNLKHLSTDEKLCPIVLFKSAISLNIGILIFNKICVYPAKSIFIMNMKIVIGYSYFF